MKNNEIFTWYGREYKYIDTTRIKGRAIIVGERSDGHCQFITQEGFDKGKAAENSTEHTENSADAKLQAKRDNMAKARAARKAKV